MYQWALELDPSLFRTHVLLGDVCFGTERTTCALEAYQQALQLQPDNQEVLQKLESLKQKNSEG
jgi:cytochrome c-type biogenesis protein CcmH/NrfG